MTDPVLSLLKSLHAVSGTAWGRTRLASLTRRAVHARYARARRADLHDVLGRCHGAANDLRPRTAVLRQGCCELRVLSAADRMDGMWLEVPFV